MKLVRVPQVDGPFGEMKRRFADFNRTKPPTRGRRYPDELKQLVCQAAAQGCKVAELCRLTGLSATGVRRWLPTTGVTRPALPRRLEIVRADLPPAPTQAFAAVVHLPSGVTIEFVDGRSLTSDLVTALAATEGKHAATR